jgi:hypothetical protein
MDRGSDPRDRGVTITDIDIPFWRIVAIMIKWILAMIPAYIILVLIFGAIILVIAIVAGLLTGDLSMMMRQWSRGF